MGFLEGIKKAVTGKTELERKQEAYAMAEIRRKAIASGLKEREAQAIRYAKEKEKAIYDKKIKELRTPKPSFFSGAGNFGSPFGQPRMAQAQPSPQKIYKSVYVKKGKHYVKRRRAVAPRKIVAEAPMFNPITGSGRRFNPFGI